MANTRPEPGEIEISLLSLFSPSLRVSMLEDKAFRDRSGLSVDAAIRFDQAGLEFKRSALFTKIRELLAEKEVPKELNDNEGRNWTLSFDSERKRMLVAREDQQVFLPDLTCLSANKEERLAWFNREVERYDIRDEPPDVWRVVLGERALEDEEVDSLLSEFRSAPIYVTGAIVEQLRRKTINLPSIIPSDLRYYDRLIGEPSSEETLRKFIDKRIVPRIRTFVERNSAEGLKNALLISSHPWIPQAIDLGSISRDRVLEFYRWLETKGDRFSQLGGVECGLAHLDRIPELEPILTRIAEQFVADRPETSDGRIGLVCSLIILVEGELARTGICRRRPPFWRRLASIAHASVLERAILQTGMPTADFCEWAMQNRGQLYYLQSFLDMRKEPRWNPDLLAPGQLKAEFVGRLATAAQLNLGKIRAQEARTLFDGEGAKTVRSEMKFSSYFPGPLEGGIPSPAKMPSEIEADLDKGLGEGELTPRSFAGLVNSSLVFRIDQKFANLAAESLRRVNYQLRRIASQEEAFSLLSGLATVAAVTRSVALAEEVRILMRVLRRRPAIGISQDSALRIGLAAAAAHADVTEWCRFVGEFMTELAFEDMAVEDARGLHHHILVLRQLEPRLWQTTGRADAATSALIHSLGA